MNWLELESMHVLTENILLPVIISTAATLVHVARAGWHGIWDFLAKWSVAIFCGVLAHWVTVHYGITGAMSAVVISMSALFSHQIMDIIFHPRIKDAVESRIVREIVTFGRRETGKDAE